MGALEILGRLALTAGAVVWVLILAPVALLLILCSVVWALALDMRDSLGEAWFVSLDVLDRFTSNVADLFAVIWER